MGKSAFSKVKSLGEALNVVEDGTVVGLGGLMYWRRPIRAVRAIIEKGLRDLTVATFVGSIEVDMLASAGCLSKVHACLVGLQAFGIASNFRAKVESGELEFIEHGEGSIVLALKAAGMRVPFLPTKALLGSELLKVNDWKTFHCPLSSDVLVAVPALKVDVAIVHVPRSDEKGNAHIEGAIGIDSELVFAAEKVIITAEEIVSTKDIMKEPYKTRIFFHTVDAVVELPGGAYPTSCYPFYRVDPLHLLDYAEHAADHEWVKGYLAEQREGKRDDGIV